MSLPTEDEIRALAEELGLLDEHGNYPRDKRTQLAAVAVKMRSRGYMPDGGDGPEPLTTARVLAQFHGELIGHQVPESVADAIVIAAVPELIARDGLITEENSTS